VSFDEEHLDDHYLCQREVEELHQRIRELEAAVTKLNENIDDYEASCDRKDARIAHLEAALHEIADYSEQFIGDDEDGDEREFARAQAVANAGMYKVNQIADTALGGGPALAVGSPPSAATTHVERLKTALAESREYRKHVQSHCEHDWAETLHGPDTVGEHCFICGVDREYDYEDEP
jgi:uncharacterized protein (DUF3084 family)